MDLFLDFFSDLGYNFSKKMCFLCFASFLELSFPCFFAGVLEKEKTILIQKMFHPQETAVLSNCLVCPLVNQIGACTNT